MGRVNLQGWRLKGIAIDNISNRVIEAFVHFRKDSTRIDGNKEFVINYRYLINVF